MVVNQTIGTVTQGISSTVSGSSGILNILLTVLLPVLITIGVVVGIFLYVRYQKSFNKRVILEKILSGNKKTYIDNARLKIDKEGIQTWQLKSFKKIKVSVPPSRCITIDGAGHDLAKGLLISDTEIQWVETKLHLDELSAAFHSALEKKKKFEEAKSDEERTTFTLTEKEKEDLLIMESLIPISSNQRMNHVYDYKMASKLRKMDLKELILPIVSMIFVLIIVITSFIYIPQMYDKVKDITNLNIQYEQERTKNDQLIINIANNQGLIEQKLGINPSNSTGVGQI